MKNNISYEVRTFSNGMQAMDLLCEVLMTEGSKIFRRVKSPEGRFYTPKFKLGEQIYITYHKEKWFMVSIVGRPLRNDSLNASLSARA